MFWSIQNGCLAKTFCCPVTQDPKDFGKVPPTEKQIKSTYTLGTSVLDPGSCIRLRARQNKTFCQLLLTNSSHNGMMEGRESSHIANECTRGLFSISALSPIWSFTIFCRLLSSILLSPAPSATSRCHNAISPFLFFEYLSPLFLTPDLNSDLPVPETKPPDPLTPSSRICCLKSPRSWEPSTTYWPVLMVSVDCPAHHPQKSRQEDTDRFSTPAPQALPPPSSPPPPHRHSPHHSANSWLLVDTSPSPTWLRRPLVAQRGQTW